MLRIAICDDRAEQRALLHRATEAYFASHDSDRCIKITDFSSPLDFLDSLPRSGGYDIVLLDICMPGLNGIDVAREIRQRKDSTEIIFVTTSSEFAIDAFRLKAAHYVVKPFTREQFEDAMHRAMERFSQKEPRRILLQSENGVLETVDIDDILYIESLRYYRIVHTKSTQIQENRRSLASIKEELDTLAPEQFILPYRGYIANQNAIRSISPDAILMQNGATIPIKSGDFRKLREAFFAWSFRKEM